MAKKSDYIICAHCTHTLNIHDKDTTECHGYDCKCDNFQEYKAV